MDTKAPLALANSMLHDESYSPLPAEITRLTGITQRDLFEFGKHPARTLSALELFVVMHKPEYLVAHSGANFDVPFLLAELTRNGVDAPGLRALPFIDTRTDIPFADEPDSRKLKHLACDIGVINHWPHRALTDVLTMMKVLSHYPMEAVLAYQKIPFVVLRAVVSYDGKELAKQRRFSWEKIGEQTWPKFWVKKVKENVMTAEIAACKLAGFDAIRIE